MGRLAYCTLSPEPFVCICRAHTLAWLCCSHSFLYLNTPAAPLPYTQVNNASVRSPYDPGVTPFSFLAGLGNVNFNYPITEVRADGSVSQVRLPTVCNSPAHTFAMSGSSKLSAGCCHFSPCRCLQVGYWNISFIDGDSTKLVTPITDTDLITFPLAVDQVRVQYPGAGTFTNAACFAEVLNASNPVTSFLLPRSTYQANYNYRQVHNQQMRATIIHQIRIAGASTCHSKSRVHVDDVSSALSMERYLSIAPLACAALLWRHQLA